MNFRKVLKNGFSLFIQFCNDKDCWDFNIWEPKADEDKNPKALGKLYLEGLISKQECPTVEEAYVWIKQHYDL